MSAVICTCGATLVQYDGPCNHCGSRTVRKERIADQLVALGVKHFLYRNAEGRLHLSIPMDQLVVAEGGTWDDRPIEQCSKTVKRNGNRCTRYKLHQGRCYDDKPWVPR